MDFENMIGAVSDNSGSAASNAFNMSPEALHIQNVINGVSEDGPHLVNSADGRGTYDASQGPDPSLMSGVLSAGAGMSAVSGTASLSPAMPDMSTIADMLHWIA